MIVKIYDVDKQEHVGYCDVYEKEHVKMRLAHDYMDVDEDIDGDIMVSNEEE